MQKEFEYSGKAMGVEYFVTIICDSNTLAKKAFEIARSHITEYEQRFSRFLPTSELSLLNKNKDMIVSEDFLNVTTVAQKLFYKTKGIFNPLVQIARLGYDKTFVEMRDDERPENWEDYDVDFSSTIIDIGASRIQLHKGQKLDYGGLLKGYLAEIIARKIKLCSPDITGVIVNLGGDIHTRGLDEKGDKFVFNIFNPILEDENISIELHNQSLATSGTYKRSWEKHGKKVHHILDSSGKKNPDGDAVSVSVIHEDGAKAEAYTKVFLSMSHKDAIKLLKERHLSFFIIKNDGSVIKNTK